MLLRRSSLKSPRRNAQPRWSRATLLMLATVGLALAAASCDGSQSAPAQSQPAVGTRQAPPSSGAEPCTTEAEWTTGVPSSQIEASGQRVTIPDLELEGNALGTALCRLLALGLRVAIPSFADLAHERDDRLEYIYVLRTVPSSGEQVEVGSVVTVEELAGGAVASPPPIPDEHPLTVEVPDVRGLSYSQAVANAAFEIELVPVVRISELPPLPPEASVRGLDAYVVESQSPEPGSEVPYRSSVVLILVLGP